MHAQISMFNMNISFLFVLLFLGEYDLLVLDARDSRLSLPLIKREPVKKYHISRDNKRSGFNIETSVPRLRKITRYLTIPNLLSHHKRKSFSFSGFQ